MNRKILNPLMSIVALTSTYDMDKPIRHEMKPAKKVTPPLSKGCKVWYEYGGVIALNEKNAIRKFNKLK